MSDVRTHCLALGSRVRAKGVSGLGTITRLGMGNIVEVRWDGMTSVRHLMAHELVGVELMSHRGGV